MQTSVTTGIVEAILTASSKSVASQNLLADSGIELSTHTRLPLEATSRLWANATAACHNPSFALSVAATDSIGLFGLYEYIISNASILGQAFDRVIRFSRLAHDANVCEMRDYRRDQIFSQRLIGAEVGSPQGSEHFLAAIVHYTRRLTMTHWKPTEVHFRHPCPGKLAAYSDFFKSPVIFSSHMDGLVISREVLNLPLPRADQRLLAILETFARNELATRSTTPTLTGEVTQEIMQRFAAGQKTNLELVARAMATSTRTLQRGLNNMGTSFFELLDQARQRKTEELLSQDMSWTNGEIANALQFDCTSSFVRAFRRWYGTSPKRWQESQPHLSKKKKTQEN